MQMRKGAASLMLINAFARLSVSLFLALLPTMSAQPAPESGADGYFTVDGQQIFCKQYKPTINETGVTVVLLHGARFSSQTWEDIGTLSFLADQGILAFALDLPGYAKSKDATTSDRAEFVKQVVEYVEGDIKVVVSPSVSGQFTIPFVNKYGKAIDGYVPVAPVSTDSLAPSAKTTKKLSVFAVVGEQDTPAVDRLSIFKDNFDNFDQLIINDGAHPAYLTDPDLFNARLSEFALSLK